MQSARPRQIAQSIGCCAASSLTHISVAAEVLEQLDFAQGALGQDLLAEDIGDLLDGNAFARLVVHSGTVARENCQLRLSSTAVSRLSPSLRCADHL
jgi:hypothetical protein